MPRYKLTIEYDGTDYFGWQIQNSVPSVQESIEKAIKAFSSLDTEVYGSGRTDRGVHAAAQVAHVDLAKDYNAETVKGAINHFLKEEKIVILDCEKVADDFHARFSAIRRTYKYKIINRLSPLAINRNKAWHVINHLDAYKMQEGANFLLGNHDFTSFRATHCQAKSPIITIDNISIERFNEEIIMTISARSFLHHMVRNIIGTLKKVGENKLAPIDVKKILDAKDRKAAEMTAPPDGLYLWQIDY